MDDDSMTLFQDRLPSEDRKSNAEPGEWIAVSNKMIMARFDWDIMMHRIMMVLISQIDSKTDEAFRLQHVHVKQIRDLARVSQNSIHKEAANAAAKLVREPIEFWSEDRQDYEGYPIFSVCRYQSRQGIIEAKFNKDARPFLLKLRKHFTQYRLRQAIPLSTPYAIRTYELSKMIERSGERRHRRIPVGRFRKMFSLENKYERHCDMRRRVIDPSVQEVNEETDVTTQCVDVRNGQTPVALRWSVESKTTDTEKQAPKQLPSSSRSGPEEETPPYRKWYNELSEDRKRSIREEAEERALNDGYNDEKPHSFEAGVQTKIKGLFREEREESG